MTGSKKERKETNAVDWDHCRRKLTPEVLDTVLAATRAGTGLYMAARVAAEEHGLDGLTSRAVQKHAKKDPEFAAALADAREVCDDEVERRLFESTNTSIAAQKFWLTNRRADRWRNRIDPAAWGGGDDDDPTGIEINFVPGVGKDGKDADGSPSGMVQDGGDRAPTAEDKGREVVLPPEAEEL